MDNEIHYVTELALYAINRASMREPLKVEQFPEFEKLDERKKIVLREFAQRAYTTTSAHCALADAYMLRLYPFTGSALSVLAGTSALVGAVAYAITDSPTAGALTAGWTLALLGFNETRNQTVMRYFAREPPFDFKWGNDSLPNLESTIKKLQSTETTEN